MIGTSDQSCWLAEACKILLLLVFECVMTVRGHGILVRRFNTSSGNTRSCSISPGAGPALVLSTKSCQLYYFITIIEDHMG